MHSPSLDSMVPALSGLFSAVAFYFSVTGLHAARQLIALGLPPAEAASSRSLFTKLAVLSVILLITCCALVVATQSRQLPWL